jgi:UDPglucose 6-dehydrogenase
MQNILVVGYGFVGKSVEYALTSREDSPFAIHIYDPKAGHDIDISNWTDYCAIFICVPTPPGKFGECDYSIVEHYVDMFKNPTCPIILKSTVPPSGIDKLLEINPELIYIPEFLTEKNWSHDVMNSEVTYIGTNSDPLFFLVSEILVDAGLKGLAVHVTPRVASLIKYTANTFLAMKVVYMHEMYSWLKSEGKEEEYSDLIFNLKYDPRMGSSHFKAPGDHGLGYAGSCFPKDVRALIAESEGMLDLLNEVHFCNTMLRQAAV